VIFQHLYFTR